LQATGFTIDALASDADLETLPDGADYVRATRTYTLGELRAKLPFISEGIGSLAALAGIGLTGDLSLSAAPVFRITVGVDSEGFYIQGNAEPLLSVPFHLAGNVSSQIGNFGSVSGEAMVNLSADVLLVSSRDDGRVRLDDLLDDEVAYLAGSFGG